MAEMTAADYITRARGCADTARRCAEHDGNAPLVERLDQVIALLEGSPVRMDARAARFDRAAAMTRILAAGLGDAFTARCDQQSDAYLSGVLQGLDRTDRAGAPTTTTASTAPTDDPARVAMVERNRNASTKGTR